MPSRRSILLANVRAGRIQRMVAGTAAASALPLGLEVLLEHYRGSFGNRWMWAPVALTPPFVAGALATVVSERAGRRLLAPVAAMYALNGLAGIGWHLRGMARKPGGLRQPTYNLLMGPPLLAPGSLALVGALGLLAPLLPRER